MQIRVNEICDKILWPKHYAVRLLSVWTKEVKKLDSSDLEYTVS